MATEIDSLVARLLNGLHAMGTRYLVSGLTKRVPALADWVVLTHGLVFFVLSFIAPAGLQLKRWQRWMVLAGIAAGTLIEMVLRYREAEGAIVAFGLVVGAGVIAATMTVYERRAEEEATDGAGSD
jgi:hypothetical protein